MRHATLHARGICKAIDCKQKAHIIREVSPQTWYKFGTNILRQKGYQRCEQTTTRKFLESIMQTKRIQWLASRLAYFDHRFRLVSLAWLPKWSSTTKTMTIYPQRLWIASFLELRSTVPNNLKDEIMAFLMITNTNRCTCPSFNSFLIYPATLPVAAGNTQKQFCKLGYAILSKVLIIYEGHEHPTT